MNSITATFLTLYDGWPNKQKKRNTTWGHNPKKNINLRIFKSFEEAVEAEALDNARKPPLEGLKETVELILRVYGVTREQLMERRKENCT